MRLRAQIRLHQCCAASLSGIELDWNLKVRLR
jgi:hypothetical protein